MNLKPGWVTELHSETVPQKEKQKRKTREGSHSHNSLSEKHGIRWGLSTQSRAVQEGPGLTIVQGWTHLSLGHLPTIHPGQ